MTARVAVLRYVKSFAKKERSAGSTKPKHSLNARQKPLRNVGGEFAEMKFRRNSNA